MQTKTRIYISGKADREELIKILAVNGYTVRLGSEKVNGKTKPFVEFWEEE